MRCAGGFLIVCGPRLIRARPGEDFHGTNAQFRDGCPARRPWRFLGFSADARAQGGDSGQIVGYVFDQTGSPIRGVKVTASSDTQIGGKKTAYTNDEGGFRFPQLIPGKFQVKAEAPKLQTVVQENIAVGINSPAEINMVMEVLATKVEEVKVVDKAPGRQHDHGQRQGDLRRRHGRLDASRQPRRHLPAGHQLHRRRHPRRPHPRRRRQPDHVHDGRVQHAPAVPHREGLGGLRDPDRGLRGGERHRPRRRGQPGEPVGLEQVRVRAGRHLRPQQPELLPGRAGRAGRQPLLRAQPDHLRAHHQGQALVFGQRRVPAPPDRPRPRRRGHPARSAARAALLVQGDHHPGLAGHQPQQAAQRDQLRRVLAGQHRGPGLATRTPRGAPSSTNISPGSSGRPC